MSFHVLTNETHNSILMGPMVLPASWFNEATGETHDLSGLTAEELRSLGWYDWVEVNTPVSPFEEVQTTAVEFNATDVTATNTLAQVALATAKAIKSEMIKDRFEDFLVDDLFTHDSISWNFDFSARQHLAELLIAVEGGMVFPEGFFIYDANGEAQTRNQTQTQALYEEMVTRGCNAQDNMKTHLDAVNALTTVDEVINYDFSSGWPTSS